jgi:hypothetical protein
MNTVKSIILLIGAVSAYGMVYANEPPACGEGRVIRDLKSAYASYASSVKTASAINFSLERELAVVEKVDELNTKRNKRAWGGYILGRSRYCVAKAQLETGESDIAYYRIDSFKNDEEKYMLTPCFLSMEKTLSVPNACASLQPNGVPNSNSSLNPDPQQ